MLKTSFNPTAGSTIATATDCLLQGELRLLRSTLEAPLSPQSTIIASNRWRVSRRNALSESAQSSRSMSRSPSTRRKTRTIFSSEQSTNDFSFIAPVPTDLGDQFSNADRVAKAANKPAMRNSLCHSMSIDNHYQS
jgi:hypothetical protein